MKHIAVIPVREGSTRVKNKNFRNFHKDKSLLNLKIEQLKSCTKVDDIVVASNSSKARLIAEQNNISFISRSDYMCNDARLHEYILDIISHFSEEDIITWAMVTNPFFTRYDQIIEAYEKEVIDKNTKDSVVTTVPYNDFLLDEKGRCINFNPGPWHNFTQELPSWDQITGAAYTASVKKQREVKYWMGTNPFKFRVSKKEAVEIDYWDDFEMACLMAPGVLG